MKKIYIFLFILFRVTADAQQPVNDSLKYRIVAANPSLQNRSRSWQKFWGTNRRAEWATPVKVPVLWLDTALGGLIPYQMGGGNETKSLRLQTKNGKEYTLRSINKSRDDVIEERFRGTFVEDIINDGLSSSYPYGAFPLAVMQEKAGIYHTMPVLVYLPQQPALDTFNARFGNDLYLLEQRPDGDWSEADHLGNFKKFSSTEKLIKEVLEDNDSRPDQYAFIKTRIFDMLIADWDRHEDNFRWGRKKKGDKEIYSPVPRDRDQAFYTHNGWLLDRVLPIAGFSFMQNFDYRIGNVKSFNFPERNYDRFFSSEMDLDDWVNAAKELQQALTDTVIAASVMGLPSEIFAISGNELIEKLKSRREQLVTAATTYYLFLAKEVDITGTEKREHFIINRGDQGEITVSAYKISKKGKEDEQPFYQRTFKPSETKEIRIYGIDEQDVYTITGNSSITVRIIGGPAKDSLMQTGSRVHIYDNRNNAFQTHSARMHFSTDSSIHAYKYESFNYSTKGWQPLVAYDRDDRVYVGLNWSLKKHKWRREPYAAKHDFGINYSLTQRSFSVSYGALYPRLIAKWDLFFRAKFDAAGWRNFAGLGNETKWIGNFAVDDYYKLRNKEWKVAAGLQRVIGNNTFELAALYHYVDLANDPGRYASEVFAPVDPKIFGHNNYGGGRWKYSFASVNNIIVPTKGFSFEGTGTYMNNFSREEFFQNYSVKLQTWLPLSKKFSLCIRGGGSTIVAKDAVLNNALIWQHAVIGGPDNFRGYRLERFWGKSAFYNNNELRFITNMKTHLLNGKIGLFGFFDDGRVWMPGQDSDIMHTSWGAGFMLAPFNFTCLTLTYGISDELKIFQFRINTLF